MTTTAALALLADVPGFDSLVHDDGEWEVRFTDGDRLVDADLEQVVAMATAG